MPLLNSITTPYAEALLQVAESRKETDEVAEQVKDLLAIWKDSAVLREAMASPVLEPEAKKAALATLFADQLTPSMQNLLKLLADRQRISALDSVLLRFLELYRTLRNITDSNPDGLGISARSVVVSTVGLVPGIEKLMDEGINCTLAVSLHTPDDELRDSLVPINNRFNVREVLAAADAYEKKTGRRYSIEYALIRDINDQSWRSDLLGRLLKNRNAHVNLIPLNPTPGSKWTASRREDEAEFVRILEGYGVPVTVRDTRGREIDGACGQLAASEKEKI